MNTIEPSMCGGDVAFLSNYFEHLFAFVVKSHRYYIFDCVSLFHFHFTSRIAHRATTSIYITQHSNI